MSEKERLARDLAATLTEQKDTDITRDQVSQWRELDVYEWLYMWDFDWDGQRWVGPEKPERRGCPFVKCLICG